MYCLCCLSYFHNDACQDNDAAVHVRIVTLPSGTDSLLQYYRGTWPMAYHERLPSRTASPQPLNKLHIVSVFLSDVHLRSEISHLIMPFIVHLGF